MYIVYRAIIIGWWSSAGLGQVNCVSQFFIVERIKVVLHLNETLSNMPFFIKYFLFSSVGLLTYRILNGWYVYSCFSTLAFDVVIFCLFAHVTCIFFPSFVVRNSGNYSYGSLWGFYDVYPLAFLNPTNTFVFSNCYFFVMVLDS